MGKHNVKFSQLERPSSRLAIGMGMSPDREKISEAKRQGNIGLGVANVVDWMKDSLSCPIFNMETIEQVRVGMAGAQPDDSINKNFGADFDPFNMSNDAPGIDYLETTMAQRGELNTNLIACAIFFHITPDPMCFTALGNSWTPTGGPETQQAAGLTPISPDVYTQNDIANLCLGPAAVTPATYNPAVMEHGWWSNYAAWHMVRGYNLTWKIGQHTRIIDEELRHTAYMPTNAQEGSASSSEVDIVNLVARMNHYYAGKGSTEQFLKVNRIRIGSVGAAGATNLGIFRPSNDDELVGATFGGMDFRGLLKGNSEFRKLTVPYLIRAGIPIGLKMTTNDDDQLNTMRAYLALSQNGDNYGGGTFPVSVTDSLAIAAGNPDGSGAANVGLERTLDGLNVPQQVASGRKVYKSGTLKLTLGVKGFEVTDDWEQMLRGDQALRDYIFREAGVRVATTGAA